MSYLQSAGVGVATAAPTPTTTVSATQEAVGRSHDLLQRLYDLRNRLNGTISEQPSQKAEVPNGVLPMASTVLGNIYAAHKLMEEIESLVG